MQNRNPSIRFALVEDPTFLPQNIASEAISSIILYRHPIFEEVLGSYENVVITHREDGTTIDEDATIQNIMNINKASRLDYIDKDNLADYGEKYEKPIVAIFTTHPSVEDLEKNYEFYSQIA